MTDEAREHARSVPDATTSLEPAFRLLFDHSPMGVLLFDAQLVIVECNARFVEILRSTRERLVGLDMNLLRDQNVLPALRQTLQGRVATYRGEYHTNTRNLSLWVDMRLMPVRDAAGRVVGGMAMVEDIGERIENERRLAESEERHRSLFENSPNAVASFDREGRLDRINEVGVRLLGYHAHELLGRKWYDALAPTQRARMEHVFESCLAGSAEALETDLLHRNGYSVPVSLTFIPILVRREVLGVFVVVQDIRARREAEEAISGLAHQLEHRVNERTEELATANRELESFSYTVSHDLRAPLRSIAGFARALVEDFDAQLPPEAQGHLARIMAAAGRMSNLIDALLELANLSRRPLLVDTVDLSQLARSIGSELSRLEPQRSVQFTVSDSAPVRGDPRLLRLVLENLLGNAWKFTARRNDAEIAFGTFEQSGETVFYVRDNGAGFDMSHVDKLFRPFQRLHAAREFEGTGVGLTTVQRIVHRHGGEVWAEATPEEGAAFYFTLPTACVRAARESSP